MGSERSPKPGRAQADGNTPRQKTTPREAARTSEAAGFSENQLPRDEGSCRLCGRWSTRGPGGRGRVHTKMSRREGLVPHRAQLGADGGEAGSGGAANGRTRARPLAF